MARDNNMAIRAIIGNDGSVSGFDLSNYSGGGSIILRLQKLGDGTAYWVVDDQLGYRTFFIQLAHARGRDENDLDELGLQVLKLVGKDNGLEERDARVRASIESRTGESLPSRLCAQ